jgi:hypothetical protein
MAVANVLVSLEVRVVLAMNVHYLNTVWKQCGIRTVDSSGILSLYPSIFWPLVTSLLLVAGLGGCPYSPGATGNAATEDIVHALHGAGYDTGVDLKQLVRTGQWISGVLGRTNESRTGRGWSAFWERQEKLAKKKAGP